MKLDQNDLAIVTYSQETWPGTSHFQASSFIMFLVSRIKKTLLTCMFQLIANQSAFLKFMT